MLHQITIPQEFLANLHPNQHPLDAVKLANHIPESFFFVGLKNNPPENSYIFIFQDPPEKNMANGNTHLATTSPLDERELALIQNLSEGQCMRTAAINAGYSESTANGTIYSKMSSPAFVKRLSEAVQHMPDARIAIAKARIPRLVKIEEKAIQLLQDDPELALKYPKSVEREYKLAGLLSDAPQAQVNVTVNVASFAAQLLEHAHPGSNDSKRTVDVHPQTLPKKHMALPGRDST